MKEFARLVRELTDDDLARFLELWPKVCEEMRPSLIAISVSGKILRDDFLDRLDQDEVCQEVLELMFKVTCKKLREFGQAVFR